MSTVLGTIALGTVIAGVISSYRLAGDVPERYGTAIFLALVMAIVGVILGIVSLWDRDRFYLFGWIGIGVGVIALMGISLILYAGTWV